MNREKLMGLRKGLLDELTYHLDALDTFTEATSSGIIRTRIKATTSTFNQFLANWNNIAAEAKYDTRSYEVEIKNNRTLSDRYYTLIGHCEDLLPSNQLLNQSNVNANSTLLEQRPERSSLKIPTIHVKPFSGDINDWEEFRDTFLTVFPPTKFSNCQRLLQLKGLLGDQPSLLIKNLKSTDENFELAWKILSERYSNKRRIVYAHYITLTNIPVIIKESAQEIRSLLDISNAAITAIKSKCGDVSSLCQYLVFLLSSKLDAESKKHWEEHLQASSELPTYEQFKKYLEIRLNILENLQAPIKCVEKTMDGHKTSAYKASPNQQARNTAKSFHTKSTKTIQCPICSKDHRPFECPQIKSIPVAPRRDLVAKNALCENCLYKHTVEECKSRYSCLVCNQKHNSLLHSDTPTKTSSSSTENSFCAHLGHKNMALLATARVTITTEHGNQQTLRALLDQGSSVNLLTEAAAQRLRVYRQKCDISLITVGESNGLRAKHQAVININSMHSPFQCKTDVVIVPKITNIVAVPKVAMSNWTHLDHLTLADSEYQLDGPIDLLIGVEVMSQILLEGLKRGPPNTPIAQKTRLGWVISGSIDSKVPNQSCCLFTRAEANPDLGSLTQINRFGRFQN